MERERDKASQIDRERERERERENEKSGNYGGQCYVLARWRERGLHSILLEREELSKRSEDVSALGASAVALGEKRTSG